MKRLVIGILLGVVLLIAGWLVWPRLAEAGYLRRHAQEDRQGTAGEGTITPENVARLRLVEQRGWGTINDVAWAPDSRSLALATTTGIRLVDARSLNLLGHIATEGRVLAVAFSADGSLVAGAVEEQGVGLWRVDSGTFVKLLQVPEAHDSGGVGGLQFSEDGRWVAATWERVLFVWRVETGFQRLQIPPQEPNLWIPVVVSFLPDGRLLYADEEQLYALDIETRATEVIAPFGYSSNGASAVDAAGTRQALGGCGQLNLFEVGQDTPHSILLQDDTCLKQVVFSTDGQQVAALLASGAMYLVSEDGSVRPLEAGGQPNNASWRSVPLRFSPDGQSLAWVAAPWALHLYHTADGTLEQTLRSPGASITAVHFENSAEGLVVLDEGDQVSLAQITLEERVASWEGDTSYWINGYQPRAGFSADGSLVWLRHGLGCTVRETETGRLYGDGLPCGEKTAISPNGDRLAVSYDPVNSGDPARVLVYHTRTGARLHTLRFQAYLLRSLQFSPDGQLLLAVEDDGGSFLWAGGRRVFPWVSDLGWRTVFAPDGLGLVSGSRIVDLSSGAVSSLPQGQQSQVAVSPDGRLMARRAEDGTIELWDVVQVKLLHRLSSLPGWKALLAFSADGSRLLLVQDGVMAFWGVK